MSGLFAPETIINTLVIGSMVSGLLAIAIAGQLQEMRFKRLNQANIEALQHGITNYARKQAQLATASKTIRKGHE